VPTDMSSRNESLDLIGVELSEGFYELEKDCHGCFIWAQSRFRVRRLTRERYMVLHACYNGTRGTLALMRNGVPAYSFTMCQGWGRYAVDLTDMANEVVEFEVSPIVPVPDDHRELGIMIRSIELTGDRSLVQHLDRVLQNRALNQREFLEGRTLLNSYPVGLRIDIEHRCNMNPPCVYCEWEWTKQMEARNDYVFTPETLTELGGFYECAEEVADCSVGETFLNQNLRSLLEEFHRARKHVEITTNGILLDQANRRMLLGKDIACYFSIDAATATGYARYRNDHFDTIIENLRCLCREKKDFGNRPLVTVSFIAMTSNRNELPAFLSLMKDVGVDSVKIRSLSVGITLDHQIIRRGSRTFDYDAEVLNVRQVREVAQEARAAADPLKLDLDVELEFGDALAAMGGPICSEPWSASYILKRGIQPCCFAHESLGAWSDRGDRGLAEFVADIFNGREMQQMRERLANGDLPRYCRDCLTCPIVRKRTQCGK